MSSEFFVGSAIAIAHQYACTATNTQAFIFLEIKFAQVYSVMILQSSEPLLHVDKPIFKPGYISSLPRQDI